MCDQSTHLEGLRVLSPWALACTGRVVWGGCRRQQVNQKNTVLKSIMKRHDSTTARPQRVAVNTRATLPEKLRTCCTRITSFGCGTAEQPTVEPAVLWSHASTEQEIVYEHLASRLVTRGSQSHRRFGSVKRPGFPTLTPEQIVNEKRFQSLARLSRQIQF